MRNFYILGYVLLTQWEKRAQGKGIYLPRAKPNTTVQIQNKSNKITPPNILLYS